MRSNHYLNALLLTVFFISGFNFNSTGQEIKRAKSPTIYITDNLSSDLDLNKVIKGKTIILDFWATWCAPCLAAIPHLNKIQQHYKADNNIMFLSLSDEPKEKIAPILKRFYFDSYVATDTTGQTHSNFGITSLPRIFVIDGTGNVQFEGRPQDLSNSLIDSILKNKENVKPVTNVSPGNIEITPPSILDESTRVLYDDLTKAFFNDSISSYFELFITTKNNIHKDIKTASKNSTRIIQTNANLGVTLSGLLECGLNQINLPEDFKKATINYCFKASDLKNKHESSSRLLAHILNDLDLSLDSVAHTHTELSIEITDSKLLQSAISNIKSAQMRTSTSDENTILAIQNNQLQSLRSELHKIFGMKVKFKNIDAAILNLKYDMTIECSSLKSLNHSLAYYGLSITEENVNGPRYEFTKATKP